MSREPEAPPRLIEMAGPAGDCLRQVLDEQAPCPIVPRFVELRERRQRRVRRQRGLLLGAFAAMTVLGAAALRPREQPASIHAEVASASHHARPVAQGPTETPRAPIEPPAELQHEAQGPTPPAAPVSPSPVRAVKARAAETTRRSEEQPAIEADSNRGASACAELTRSGAAERALACYETLAQGSGMVAELALFEQARLEGKMMRRPGRALLKLDSYRQRFPNGALRGEVMLTQIEWLLASGDKGRARQVVEEALDSGLLRERTAELERLRATLESPAP